MGNCRSYWCCGLIAGVALLALGLAQMNVNLSATRSAHAPMIRAYRPDGSPMRGPHNESVSTNWSGYALSTGSTGTYTSASITWTVPTVTYINYGSSNPDSYESSSSWVGIGGFASSDLIQLGTEQYITSTGSTTYQPWYEILPASEKILPSQYTVSPGDAMSASLSCTSNCTANNSNTTWALSMTDSTKGWTFSKDLTYESCLCSAEWIQEAPKYNVVVAMPNYGTTPFSNLTVNGGNPGLSLSADGIILQDNEGGYSTPCQAFNGNQVGNGNQFVVAYGQACASTFDTHDFNDDAKSDIAWRDSSGDNAIWLMNGSTILSSAGLGTISTAWSIVGQRDFNGDGMADLLWRDSSGDLAIWFMNGTTVTSGVGLGTVTPVWSIVGTGDFNGDGRGDILWRDTSGDIAIWLMNGSTILSSAGLGSLSTAWSVAGTGDFNGDGMSDILWQDTSGDIAIWFMNGTTVSSGVGLGTIAPPWTIVGTGDFNGDGKSDILWRNTSTGAIAVWLMNGSAILSSAGLGSLATTWSVVETGDFNGDGKSDILWNDTSGDAAIWFMNGTMVSSGVGLGTIPTSWSLQGAGAD
jgi:hypothetical protein